MYNADAVHVSIGCWSPSNERHNKTFLHPSLLHLHSLHYYYYWVVPFSSSLPFVPQVSTHKRGRRSSLSRLAMLIGCVCVTIFAPPVHWPWNIRADLLRIHLLPIEVSLPF